MTACRFPLPLPVAFPPGLPALPSLKLPLLDTSLGDLGIPTRLPGVPIPAFPPALPSFPIPKLPALLANPLGELGIPTTLPGVALPQWPPGLPALPSLKLPLLPTGFCPLD